MCTRLKKWMVRVWGWGPSDCQNVFGVGERRAGMEQEGLEVETVQEARELMLRRWGRRGSESETWGVGVSNYGSMKMKREMVE